MNAPASFQWAMESCLNPIRTGGGGGGRGCFPPGSMFFANNFGSNKGTQSKLSDVPKI